MSWKTFWIKIEYLAKARLPHALDAKPVRRKGKGTMAAQNIYKKRLGCEEPESRSTQRTRETVDRKGDDGKGLKFFLFWLVVDSCWA